VTPAHWRPLAGLWFRGLARLGVYRRLVIRERRFDEPVPDLPLPAGLEVRPLMPHESAAYAALRPDQGQAECERRLAASHWCFATWRDGAIISASWTARTRCLIDYLERHIRLDDDDEVYTYDLFSPPRPRGDNASPLPRTCPTCAFCGTAGTGER
jgi:hypothetical protein